MLAFAMLAVIRHHANARRPQKSRSGSPGRAGLVRWSVQEIRRVAVRLAQRRIRPAHILAWSLWRRAHQAAAQRSHLSESATVMLG